MRSASSVTRGGMAIKQGEKGNKQIQNQLLNIVYRINAHLKRE